MRRAVLEREQNTRPAPTSSAAGCEHGPGAHEAHATGRHRSTHTKDRPAACAHFSATNGRGDKISCGRCSEKEGESRTAQRKYRRRHIRKAAETLALGRFCIPSEQACPSDQLVHLQTLSMSTGLLILLCTDIDMHSVFACSRPVLLLLLL